MREKILVIEDEIAIAHLIRDELEFEGFAPLVEITGEGGYAAIARESPDLVLLDLRLPDISGFEVCRRLRDEGSAVPIILISARDQEVDKVRGLALGADDYLTKPFGMTELVARVRAVLRRRAGPVRQSTFSLRGLQLDVRRREASLHGRPLDLTRKEFDLVRLLFERQGEVVSRDDFLDAVWPGVFVTHRTVDTHVALLRKKLRQAAPGTDYIVSVHGVGYKLSANGGDE